ncbi:DUF1127 domain-containing protein [Pseudosulfitobacter koreensis]|uniref:DUF1127 domain-containing protein n=1 Tax=Pseudosulfitobacter koreensis TaxID=2968472 RepID=A0ABT1Z4I4_9RHOB|nr:DUF1127 domain-containing protein [Pseudosulfitobacter koreense]MCR8828041.1 DUF1127 domain-containing protein [Pseudosulfitobacter koreense]
MREWTSSMGSGRLVHPLFMEHVMHPYMFNPNILFLRPSSSSKSTKRPGALRRMAGAAFRNLKRRKMIATLQRMDDHLLRDIGIERSDIPRVVESFSTRELGMRPVSPDVARTSLKQSRAAKSDKVSA